VFGASRADRYAGPIHGRIRDCSHTDVRIMKTSFVLAIGVMALALAPLPVHATPVLFNLNSTAVPGFGASPYVTVSMELMDSGSFKGQIRIAIENSQVAGKTLKVIETGPPDASSGKPVKTTAHHASGTQSNPPAYVISGVGGSDGALSFYVDRDGGFTSVYDLIDLTPTTVRSNFTLAILSQTAAVTTVTTPEPAGALFLAMGLLGLCFVVRQQ
jgi:hypothetical protein